MATLANLLVVIHVIADTVWIGAILSVAFLLVAARDSSSRAGSASAGEGSVTAEARLAERLYLKLATPAFVVAFLTGAARLAFDARLYFVQTHFMHAKLMLALIVIVLHHVIGARAKKAARQSLAPRGLEGLAVALFVAAAGAVYFAVLKPF